ncbi:phage holin family protein [Nitrincola iocasae]|uniref:Uncharacterized protein n=1 Tax=Nitrincola iocasae TaxID=2614693 RepID=A0A5J6LGM7_9GAMM|nr:phage holin family protein [Nitrincola iocasae]QEW07523.1 hypothetical protein F5I99_14030 [Nitrincola iocasae]
MTEKDSVQDNASDKDNIEDITSIFRTLSADMLHLVVVETKLFGHTLLAMIGLSLVIALLVIGGWLFTGAAVAMALVSLQAFSLTSALLTVALINLVLATLTFWRLRYITRDLTFRQSRASVNSLITHARTVVDTAEH